MGLNTATIKTLAIALLLASTISLAAVAHRTPAGSGPANQFWLTLRRAFRQLVGLPVSHYLRDTRAKREVKKLYAEMHELTLRNKVAPGACTPWSDSPGCSCEDACPRSFEIFNIQQHRYKSEDQDLLAFWNEDPDYADVAPRVMGYCWAHATLDRQFTMLAFFDPENKQAQEVPNRETDPSAWISFYIDKTKDILSGNATVIPYFADLRSFSAEPEIQLMLKKIVPDLWAELAASGPGAAQFVKTAFKGVMRWKDQKAIISNLRDRLELGQLPKIVFSKKGSLSYIHVVNVFDIRESTIPGNIAICLMDNKKPLPNTTMSGCDMRLEIEGGDRNRERSKMWYHGSHGIEPVDQIRLAPEHDEEVVDHVISLQNTCEMMTGCRK